MRSALWSDGGQAGKTAGHSAEPSVALMASYLAALMADWLVVSMVCQ